MEQVARRNSFTHRVGRKVREVTFDEIVAFQANHKYVDAFLVDGSAILLSQDQDTIKGLKVEFPEFMQINRGILVRQSAVHSLERDVARCRYDVVMKDFVFPVSRRFVPLVRKALKNEPSPTETNESVCGSVCANAG
jgi:DNA-binding LytR/AlgR family response regulator